MFSSFFCLVDKGGGPPRAGHTHNNRVNLTADPHTDEGPSSNTITRRCTAPGVFLWLLKLG
jgi:hypothetical protein